MEASKHSQDIFDVYGDYSHIHPISVKEAIQRFKHFYTEVVPTASKQLTIALKNKNSTVESRKAQEAALDKQKTEIEILLFRSIMRENDGTP